MTGDNAFVIDSGMWIYIKNIRRTEIPLTEIFRDCDQSVSQWSLYLTKIALIKQPEARANCEVINAIRTVNNHDGAVAAK